METLASKTPCDYCRIKNQSTQKLFSKKILWGHSHIIYLGENFVLYEFIDRLLLDISMVPLEFGGFDPLDSIFSQNHATIWEPPLKCKAASLWHHSERNNCVMLGAKYFCSWQLRPNVTQQQWGEFLTDRNSNLGNKWVSGGGQCFVIVKLQVKSKSYFLVLEQKKCRCRVVVLGLFNVFSFVS